MKWTPTDFGGGFFPTRDQAEAIRVAFEHMMEGTCGCLDMDLSIAMFQVLDLLTEIEAASNESLRHLEESWNKMGLDENEIL